MSGHSLGPLQELHLGVVTDSADPDSRGRVKVRLHSLGLELWAPVVTLGAGAGYGVSCLPRVAEQVVVAFLSPEQPLVLGAVWSGASSAPSDASPVEERYVVRTPAGIQVMLEDGQQGAKVKIETPAGYHLTIDEGNGGKVTVEKASEKIEMSASGISITTSAKVKVDAPQVEVNASMVQVNAGMSKFSGVVQCDTLISNAVVSASYTPGAGNVW
jgi:uncharacterized protein involved in type VI secretion and phage assembly